MRKEDAMSPETQPWGDPARAKVLFVGHDARLQRSDTVAPYAFFADYYSEFSAKPTYGPDGAKYGLAEKVFEMVGWLTGGLVLPDEVVVTNLCNETLPHAPKNRTVLIPEEQASRGIAGLRQLLSGSSIRVVMATSQQVNYWLQRLHFCTASDAFLKAAEPKGKGVECSAPYYEPRRGRAFTLVCGKRFDGPDGVGVFPVVHPKNWPLVAGFATAYGAAHERCRERVQAELG